MISKRKFGIIYCILLTAIIFSCHKYQIPKHEKIADAIRDCPQTKASLIFGIILAAFRFLFWGHIFFHDIAPKKGIENRLKRTRKSTDAWFVDSLLELIAKLRRDRSFATTSLPYFRLVLATAATTSIFLLSTACCNSSIPCLTES